MASYSTQRALWAATGGKARGAASDEVMHRPPVLPSGTATGLSAALVRLV